MALLNPGLKGRGQNHCTATRCLFRATPGFGEGQNQRALKARSKMTLNELLIRNRGWNLALGLIACIVALAPNTPSPCAQSPFGKEIAASNARLQSPQRRAPVLGA